MSVQTSDTQFMPPAWQAADTSVDERSRVTTSEAARLAGVSTSTIRRWVNRGYLESLRTPAGFLIDASGLEAAREQAQSRRGRAAPSDGATVAASDAQADTVVSEQPSSVREPDEFVWRPVPASAAQAPRITPALAMISPLPNTPGRATRRQRTPDSAKVLEGLQRGLILEQAKHQRAVRLKDRAAMQSSAYRLAELQQRLDDVREGLRADAKQNASKLAGAPFTPATIRALFPTAAVARAVPSRRTFNIATLLILNGFLMMLMSFIS